MMKLFFVITTLMMLAKSEISIDWICEETHSMGNCSTVPKITNWLENLSDNIDNDDYTNLHYCPFDIVERHSRCMVSYLRSCQQYMSDARRHFIYSYVPRTERTTGSQCDKSRAYKKEFREHTKCTKVMYNNEENPWDVHSINQEVEFGLLPKKTEFRKKCEIYHKYWEMQNSWINKLCGVQTEKFSRQVLSNMWPIMGLLNICGDRLSAYGYFES